MTLEKLKEMMLNGEIFSSDVFEGIDLDEILDGREEDFFDSLWIKSFKRLEPMPLNERHKEQIDEIREISFKMTYEFTESSDLSAFISDDFEIISKAFLLNLNDPFINSIWLSYRRGTIPNGKIELVDGRINEI